MMRGVAWSCAGVASLPAALWRSRSSWLEHRRSIAGSSRVGSGKSWSTSLHSRLAQRPASGGASVTPLLSQDATARVSWAATGARHWAVSTAPPASPLHASTAAARCLAGESAPGRMPLAASSMPGRPRQAWISGRRASSAACSAADSARVRGGCRLV